MFALGFEYTREDIFREVGGSKVACLPTVAGTVVAACLLKKLSPLAPAVVLCGQGTRTSPTSWAFAHQTGALPVFIKIAARRWQYQGRFSVKRSYSSGLEFECLIAGSGRSLASVSCMVLLEPIK